jgi:3-dehydroquinate synthase
VELAATSTRAIPAAAASAMSVAHCAKCREQTDSGMHLLLRPNLVYTSLKTRGVNFFAVATDPASKLRLDVIGSPSFNRRMVECLTVMLGERSYPIRFGANLVPDVREQVKKLTADGRRVAVVTDSNVAQRQSDALREMFGNERVFAVEAGENAKSLEGLGRVLDYLAEQKLDRGGVVFAVGGGVVGDLAGFAAASYLRGIDFYQVPTTLLAMVDSSVGGKTGINIKAGKNLVGAFHQPKGVFISTGLLATLPAREFAAGMAEVIKYGLLGDPGLFARLETDPLTSGSDRLADEIRRCCALKAQIVEADERETAQEGGRALLNLGHTFGHAIENVAGYGSYLHGEAVAIGLCAAARLSQKLDYITSADVARIERVVGVHALPTRLRAPLAYHDLLAAMNRDKKVRAGGLRFVVLKRLGEASTQANISAAFIEASFREVGVGG